MWRNTTEERGSPWTRVSSARVAKGEITDMRTRRFIAILERPLLGAAMSVVLFVVERRLNRTEARGDARPAPGSRPGNGERGTT
jgi:hypothetical protein